MPISQSSRRALDRSLVHGVAWTAAGRWATQLITWASLFVVARLLSPGDYGLVGMAAIVLNFAQLIAEFGIGTTIVALRDLTGHEIRQINTLAILLGVAGTLAGAAAAPLLGWFYETPALVPVTMVMSLTFLVTAFRAVPSAILQRDMDFKFLALNQSIQAVSQAAFTVCMAALGGAYWSLVLGALFSYLLANAALAARCRYGLSAPRADTLRKISRFSSDVLISRVATYCYSNLDYLIIGKLFGKAQLGTYSFAFMTANLPIRKVTTILMQVTPSLFSAVKHDAAAVRRYVRNLTEAVSLITFPFAAGVALTAPELLTLALGEQWQGAILPLQVLGWTVPLRSLLFVVPQALLMMGESRVIMWNSVRAFFVMSPAFLLGARWGVAGVAATWLVIYPFCVLPLFRRIMRKVDMPARDYYRAVRAPLWAIAVMAVVVSAVSLALPAGCALWLRALAKVGAGVVTYGVALWAIYPAARLAMWKDLILSMRPHAGLEPSNARDAD